MSILHVPMFLVVVLSRLRLVCHMILGNIACRNLLSLFLMF